MGEEAEKEKALGGKWYIINAAKNWFATDITFNQVVEIQALFKEERREPMETREALFERVLMRWVEVNEKPAEVTKTPVCITGRGNADFTRVEIFSQFKQRGLELDGVQLHEIFDIAIINGQGGGIDEMNEYLNRCLNTYLSTGQFNPAYNQPPKQQSNKQ